MKSTMHDVAWLAATSRCAIGGLLADRGDAESLGAEGWPRHRDYSPGDDFRWIDWSVCARHDELISRYRPAGEDRGVTILVDCSRSMSVGEPKKFDAARRGAAALGAMALGRFPLRDRGDVCRGDRRENACATRKIATGWARAVSRIASRGWR